MSWRGVRALVRRDLSVALGSKAVVVPALVVPLVLLVRIIGAVLYAAVASLTVGTQVGRVILPTAELAVMALWAGPTFAAAALPAVLLVSVRTSTTQEAFQLGGVVVPWSPC